MFGWLCDVGAHVPVNYDPTGGDPNQGGPTMLTKCERCGKRLDNSDAARLHNQYQRLLREYRNECDARVTSEQIKTAIALSDKTFWKGVAMFLAIAFVVSLAWAVGAGH